jgi:MFS transporter, UMF1 family
MKTKLLSKPVIAWAFYDWANSAFATTVMVAFFPVFFKQYWGNDLSETQSTFWLGMANTGASLLLAILAPLLGTLGDRGGSRLKFLLAFTVIGVLSTAGLWFVAQGEWQWAALLFAIGSVGFWGGIIFYDSLLMDVAPHDRLDAVSGVGYSLGYLGGGVLLVINVLMFLQPALFGFADAAAAVKASFITVAVWWALFAIPIFRVVKERAPVGARGTLSLAAVRESFAELVKTAREVRRYRAVAFFLLAYWMYIDGVNTIQKMAVDYGLALGLNSSSLIQAIVIVQFVGFPAALVFGWIGQRISPLVGIFICIATYAAITVYATVLSTANEFYVIAAVTGCVQGGIQSLSRSYYGRLIPRDRAGEFFGFYNMMSKFAAVLGPALMGTTALVTGQPRTAILSIVVLFIGGAALLVYSTQRTPLQDASIGAG